MQHLEISNLYLEWNLKKTLTLMTNYYIIDYKIHGTLILVPIIGLISYTIKIVCLQYLTENN